ncbi:MAG: hypothetical protein C4346_07340, partial [Chloroflexota bacterium]
MRGHRVLDDLQADAVCGRGVTGLLAAVALVVEGCALSSASADVTRKASRSPRVFNAMCIWESCSRSAPSYPARWPLSASIAGCG